MQMCSFLLNGSRKMSRAGTRWGCVGRVRRKMTSRNSRHGVNDSKVFFIVLIAIWFVSLELFIRRHEARLTNVPRRATFAPFALTRARETLPKLPSPISLMTSNRSSNAVKAYDAGLWYSKVTVMLEVSDHRWSTAHELYGGRVSRLSSFSDRWPSLLVCGRSEAQYAFISGKGESWSEYPSTKSILDVRR